MVLDFGDEDQSIFLQTDVRETPAATATATSVGLTDGKYIVVDYDSDMTAERKITAGEGINFTDAGVGSTFTISGENATDSNKGIASFAIADFSLSSGVVNLKDVVVMSVDGDSGTATPSSNNFDILGGDVITTAGASNNITITNSDHTAVGLNTSKLTNVTTNLSAGTLTATTIKVNSSDGTDATLVEADTTNAGILGSDKWDEIVANTTHRGSNGTNHANVVLNDTHRGSAGSDHSDVGLNTTHRGLSNNPHTVTKAQVGLTNVTDNAQITSVTGGTGLTSSGGTTPSISLTNKTSYWSCPGVNFATINGTYTEASPTWSHTTGRLQVTTEVGGYCMAQIDLPNGAVVTGATVYGNTTGNAWTLYRVTLSGGAGATMATAAINTEDTSISNATIDNSTYTYFIKAEITGPDTEYIYGARIKYTTDYI